MKTTITAFKKLTVAKIKAALPLEVTSSGKTLFNAVSQVIPTATYDDDTLVKLLIGNDKDSVHIADAKKRINSWKSSFATNPVTQTPTPPTNPSTPSTPTVSEEFTQPNWLGDWSGNVKDFVNGVVSKADKKTSLFIAYNIPGRDNGNYSAGGLHSASEYHNWIAQIAEGIGSAKAIVVVEPDALGLSRSLSDQAKSERYAMLNDAVKLLKANKNTRVYVDSSTWAGVEDSVNLLKKITGMDGFSVNVSGYDSQQSVVDYATQVADRTGLTYVTDTSRNGNGAPYPGKWCNMTDTKVGALPTSNTGIPKCDAFLWLKVPGESDGLGINDDGSHPRNDVPSAGTMWPEFRDAIYSGDWTAFKKKYNV